MPKLRSLGTRGAPASHGGFETFAERLALHLVGHHWRVVVYCQLDGSDLITTDCWNRVERVLIPVSVDFPKRTILFDWRATCHAAQHRDLCLTLGDNIAIFCLLLQILCIRNLINMDGIEWRRAKWGKIAKAWFWLNDWLGCWFGKHLIADKPHIQADLTTRVSAQKITTIPYDADAIHSAPTDLIDDMGPTPGSYITVIARPEPENSLLEFLQCYASRPRHMPMVVLGHYEPDDAYHHAVKAAASADIRFIDAISVCEDPHLG